MKKPADRLVSWKAIAAFFGREVRTVQLWEKHEGLPVHRHVHRKQGRIYAYRAELEAWQRAAMRSPAGHKPSFISPDGPAADAYALARFLWSQRTPSSLRRAEGHFRRALDLDPKFYPAYAGLADCMVSYAFLRLMRPREAADAANGALHALMPLMDRRDADSLKGIAAVMVCCNWNWESGERHCAEACEQNPADSRALQIYAAFMGAHRRHAEAIRYAAGAVRLDPFCKALNLEAGYAHYFAGDPEGALPYALRAIEIDPDFAAGHALLGQAETERGNWDQAETALSDAVYLGGGAIAYRAALAYARAKSGDSALARQTMEGIDPFEAALSCPVSMAALHAGLGEPAAAIRHLWTAREQRDGDLIGLASDPRFAPLRRQADFRDVVQSLGLN